LAKVVDTCCDFESCMTPSNSQSKTRSAAATLVSRESSMENLVERWGSTIMTNSSAFHG